MVAELARGTGQHDLAVAEDADPVGYVECVDRVLLDEEDADPAVGGGAHREQQSLHDEWREPERELVHEQQPGARREGATRG